MSKRTAFRPLSTALLSIVAFPCLAGEPVVTPPGWKTPPGVDRVMRAYPVEAFKQGVSGTAKLNCLITVDGRVTDCQILSETPPGYGFGRAAIVVAQASEFHPLTVDGVATETRVRIPMSFTAP
ncbi:MAG: TonB family protein [Caulobacter sp.]|nr:TonB family protein [Caulobacter sp.]